MCKNIVQCVTLAIVLKGSHNEGEMYFVILPVALCTIDLF